MTIKKITLAVFLAASCSLGWQFYRMYRESVARQVLYEQHGIIVCDRPSIDERARLFIELCLLLAVVGSRFRGLTNTLLTVTGVSGATSIYMSWWQFVFEVASYGEEAVQSLPHFVYLWRGNALDLGIAFSIAALIVFTVRDAAYSLVYETG